MPLSVSIAGGPDSTRSLSNLPLRVGSTTLRLAKVSACPRSLTGGCSPAFISTGVQLIRSSDVAHHICESPQYIQYLPLIFTAIACPSTYFETMEPDLDHLLAYFP